MLLNREHWTPKLQVPNYKYKKQAAAAGIAVVVVAAAFYARLLHQPQAVFCSEPLCSREDHAVSEAAAEETTAQLPNATSSFIRVSGNVFVDDACREFLYTGWNGWNELLKAGLAAPIPDSAAAAPALLAAQDDFATLRFSKAVAAKLSVTRVFAAGGDHQDIQLQSLPGQYNETVFRGMDYILAQAARYGIKVVLSIINNWEKVDGKQQYVEWAGVGLDDFWTDEKVRGFYKAHLKALATRINIFTGVAYRDDPTIFSWNLFNEPRNPDAQTGPGKPGPVTAWVNEMSGMLAALDPNHMITVGEEGFFPIGSEYNPRGPPRYENPEWAGKIGQDFVEQHSSPNIHYAAFHFWPDDWKTHEPSFLPLWMEGHILAAKQLNKPLVLEEFGKVAASNQEGTEVISGRKAKRSIKRTRDPLFRQIYRFVEDSIASGGLLRATLFWEWGAAERSSPRCVLEADSTFEIIRAHAAKVAKRPRVIQPGCIPR